MPDRAVLVMGGQEHRLDPASPEPPEDFPFDQYVLVPVHRAHGEPKTRCIDDFMGPKKRRLPVCKEGDRRKIQPACRPAPEPTAPPEPSLGGTVPLRIDPPYALVPSDSPQIREPSGPTRCTSTVDTVTVLVRARRTALPVRLDPQPVSRIGVPAGIGPR